MPHCDPQAAAIYVAEVPTRNDQRPRWHCVDGVSVEQDYVAKDAKRADGEETMMSGNVIGQSIVVGVDGSDSALHAAHWAADEAARRRVSLRLLHAVDSPVLTQTVGFGSLERYLDALTSVGQKRLTEAETAVRQEYPDLEVTLDLRTTSPVPALIEASDDAKMVVLGSRGLGGFAGILAGSTVVTLAAHGHCPVAVIRGRRFNEPPPAYGAVVVGVDGSLASDSALAMAFDEASLRGVHLVAVHTWTEYVSDLSYAYARQFDVDWSEVETKESELLAQRLADWQEKYPDVTVHRVVTRDKPVRCLLEQAAEAQLLVVGSRGRGGLAGMLLGSTSQALIHHTPCPLLVVRA